MPARIDFFGEEVLVPEGKPVVLGRDGDLEIDDNPYLHRRFLEFHVIDGLMWVSNLGNSITATIADSEGLVQTWLAPGARIPLPFPKSVVWFTAGPTTYEFEIYQPSAPFETTVEISAADGDTTVGRLSLTPDQRLLIVSLAEDILRRGDRGAGAIPPSARAADRLGWTITKFNRKLDNVCEKFARLGVRGVVTDGRYNASNRRARMVEYALASRVITVDDLALLDAAAPPRS